MKRFIKLSTLQRLNEQAQETERRYAPLEASPAGHQTGHVLLNHIIRYFAARKRRHTASSATGAGKHGR